MPADQVGHGLHARQVVVGDRDACLLAVGKMVEAAGHAACLLAVDLIPPTVWDVRVVRPLDSEMIADAARHELVLLLLGIGLVVLYHTASALLDPSHSFAIRTVDSINSVLLAVIVLELSGGTGRR